MGTVASNPVDPVDTVGDHGHGHIAIPIPTHVRTQVKALAGQQRDIASLAEWGRCGTHVDASSCGGDSQCAWTILDKDGVCVPLHLTRVETVAKGIRAICSKPRHSKQDKLILHRTQALFGHNAPKAAQQGSLCSDVQHTMDSMMKRLTQLVDSLDPRAKHDPHAHAGNILMQLAELLGCSKRKSQTDLAQKVMGMSVLIASGRLHCSTKRISSMFSDLCPRVSGTNMRRVLAAIVIITLIFGAAMVPGVAVMGVALRGSRPKSFSLTDDPLHDGSLPVAVWDAEATALDTVLPSVPGIPEQFLAVMDNKRPGESRVGRFHTARGEVRAIHVDNVIGTAVDLEAIANEPGHRDGYFLLQSNGGLIQTVYDAKADAMRTIATIELPKIAKYTNYEAMEVAPGPKPGVVVVSYSMRGGSNQFGHLIAVTNAVTLQRDSDSGMYHLVGAARRMGLVDDDRADEFVRPMSDSHGVTDPTHGSGIVLSAFDGEEAIEAGYLLPAGSPLFSSTVYRTHNGYRREALHLSGVKAEGVWRDPDTQNALIVTDDEDAGSVAVLINGADRVVGARRVAASKEFGLSGIAPIL